MPDNPIAPISQLLLNYYIRRHVSLWDAEDLVQDVLLKVLHMGRTVDEVEPAYLYTAARTVLIDKYRHDSRRKQHAHVAMDADLAFEDESASPDYQLDELRVHERLEHTLNGLTEIQRKTFIDCKIHGLPMQQVANDRHVSVSAVEKLMSKAKQSLLVGIAS